LIFHSKEHIWGEGEMIFRENSSRSTVDSCRHYPL